jgi:hypothetical protein
VPACLHALPAACLYALAVNIDCLDFPSAS